MPLDIIHITTLFIDDHFLLTRGSYQWIIDNDTLQQMKSTRDLRFSPHKFKMAELEWVIDVHPNGRWTSERGILFSRYI